MNTLHCLNPDCQAVNPLGTKFCQKCGTPFLLNQRYQCDRTLGQGGFGRTHLVRDGQRGDTKVVVKQFIPSEELQNSTGGLQKALQLFHNESARLLQLDQHPQIPTLFELFEEHKSHFLVQQFIDGKTLAEELNEQGKPFTESQVRSLLLDLLPVLQFIHDRQIIHRDIKPDNIIRRQVDNRLVLIDFGAAKVATQTALAKTGTMIGTPDYAAPEQSYGQATFASDLYSLGVVCLHLLTQMHPFDLYDSTDGTFAWRDFLNNNPVDDALARVLDKLTCSALEDRYRSPQDVCRDLEQPPSPPPASPQSLPIPEPQLFPTTYTERLQGGWLRQEVLLDMVYIPAGQFMMGAPDDEPEALDYEKPQRRVSVSEFWMGNFPITQVQYQAIMGKNRSRFKGDHRPVESISWHDAVEFCQRLSAKSGKQYRLPSEAEWEYACRAGTTTPFHVGETITPDVANYDGNYTYGGGPKGGYRGQTTDVGSFLANAWGLYDMHGNVWEWCEDDWHESYKEAPKDGSAWISNNKTNLSKIRRGGSWTVNPRFCRSACRLYFNPANHFIDLGFRVVCHV